VSEVKINIHIFSEGTREFFDQVREK